MPLNMRTRRGTTEENNQVGSVFASLHTDIADPLERIIAIRQSTENAKLSGEASPLVDALKLAGVFSPVISKSVARFWSRNELSRHIPMNISTCISNVAGPDFPLYCAGARMVDYYSGGNVGSFGVSRHSLSGTTNNTTTYKYRLSDGVTEEDRSALLLDCRAKRVGH
jgi:hypothetical protein